MTTWKGQTFLSPVKCLSSRILTTEEKGGGPLFHTDWITEDRQWHKQPTSCQMSKCGSWEVNVNSAFARLLRLTAFTVAQH